MRLSNLATLTALLHIEKIFLWRQPSGFEIADQAMAMRKLCKSFSIEVLEELANANICGRANINFHDKMKAMIFFELAKKFKRIENYELSTLYFERAAEFFLNGRVGFRHGKPLLMNKSADLCYRQMIANYEALSLIAENKQEIKIAINHIEQALTILEESVIPYQSNFTFILENNETRRGLINRIKELKASVFFSVEKSNSCLSEKPAQSTPSFEKKPGYHHHPYSVSTRKFGMFYFKAIDAESCEVKKKTLVI